jgi:hypothetical protein
MKKNKIVNKIIKVVGEKTGEVLDELGSEAKNKAIDSGKEIIGDTAHKLKNIGKESVDSLTQKFGSIIHNKIMPGKPDQPEDVKATDDMFGDEDLRFKVKGEPGCPATKDVDQHSDENAKSEFTKDSDEEIHEISSDEADDKFVDSITSGVLTSGIKGIATPGEALSVVDDLVKMTGEVEKFREAQKTKRTAIEAEKEVALAKLDAQKKLLMEYLDRTFDERKLNFQKYFDVIDDALIKGNTQQLAMGLNSINELAQSSPFKDLASIDQVGKALEDKNHEWDF